MCGKWIFEHNTQVNTFVCMYTFIASNRLITTFATFNNLPRFTLRMLLNRINIKSRNSQNYPFNYAWKNFVKCHLNCTQKNPAFSNWIVITFHYHDLVILNDYALSLQISGMRASLPVYYNIYDNTFYTYIYICKLKEVYKEWELTVIRKIRIIFNTKSFNPKLMREIYYITDHN